MVAWLPASADAGLGTRNGKAAEASLVFEKPSFL